MPVVEPMSAPPGILQVLSALLLMRLAMAGAGEQPPIISEERHGVENSGLGETEGTLKLEDLINTQSTTRRLDEPETVQSRVAGPHQLQVDCDRRAIWALAAQHLSSTWGDRCAEFAFYLYLITLFKQTLLPASIFGFFTTGIAILFSGAVGRMVDSYARLNFVRICIISQKCSSTAAYAMFMILFTHFQSHIDARGRLHILVWVMFTAIVFCGCVLKLATIGISVAVERDWVTVIANGDPERLTRLNTYLRRIDLLSKLLAPFFVSLLTTVVSYPLSAAVLLGMGVVGMLFEFLWIDVVYRRLPILRTEEHSRNMERHSSTSVARAPLYGSIPEYIQEQTKRISSSLKSYVRDWLEFAQSPVFPSSIAISLLYLTVLSFDGSMLSYLKTRQFSDVFLAGMRGICVITGLLGTLAMPRLEKKIGVVRTGTWSIISELTFLIPVMLSFYIGAPREGEKGPIWNSFMLFAGMALSRTGLWAFDLCQLKEIQTTLATHPRRNTLTALQFSLQNTADLTKYIVVMILSHPYQFKYAALVSFIAVSLGTACYLYYHWKMRGHLLHLGWTWLNFEA